MWYEVDDHCFNLNLYRAFYKDKDMDRGVLKYFIIFKGIYDDEDYMKWENEEQRDLIYNKLIEIVGGKNVV